MANESSRLESEKNYGRTISLEEFGQELTRLRAEYEARYGYPCELPRNSGARRTASKRALLAEIDKLAARQRLQMVG
jgi:hypothetical protein